MKDQTIKQLIEGMTLTDFLMVEAMDAPEQTVMSIYNELKSDIIGEPAIEQKSREEIQAMSQNEC